MKQPRPLQQAAVDEIIQHMRSKSTGTDPIVLEASVGAGKSLMIAMLAAHVAKNGGKVLMLARQAELVDQNSAEALEFNVKNSIFCASLRLKSTYYPVIYGSEGSIYRALENELADIKIDLLLIDEAHMLAYDKEEAMMMVIISALMCRNPKMRICGMTGSPYRGTESIIGQFWKKKTETNMSTQTLVDAGYLVDTHFGYPDNQDDEIDFSQFEVRGDHNGSDYKEEDINRIYQGEVQKTFAICADIVAKTEESNGVLIFAGSKLHTEQVKHGLELAGIAPESIRIVTDDTGNKDRLEARKAAISGECKYFINIGVAAVGWNVPRWSVVIYLRPVGSLVFLTQSIGRELRPFLTLKEAEQFNNPDATIEDRKSIIAGSRKPFAVVYDYAGVMDRLGHLYNSPLLEQAALEKSKRLGKTIICPKCNSENSEHARRCIGSDPGEYDERCGYFWSSQACRKCQTLNDVTASECRNPNCRAMLRDPAKALLGKAYTDNEWAAVKRMDVVAAQNGGVVITYIMEEMPEIGKNPIEFYHLGTIGGKKGWEKSFLREHIRDPQWRNRVAGMNAEGVMKNQSMLDVPTHIAYRVNEKNKFTIGRKKFKSGRLEGDVA